MSVLHSIRHAITLMEELVSLLPSWHCSIKLFQSINYFKVTCFVLRSKVLGLGFWSFISARSCLWKPLSAQQARGRIVNMFLWYFHHVQFIFNLGFKNSVFKAKVMLNLCKKNEIPKSLQKDSSNPGPLAKIPQMIYLQKESSQSTKWVNFRTKETKKSIL